MNNKIVSKRILQDIAAVQFATKYNLYGREALTERGSLLFAGKKITALEEMGLIRRLTNYGYYLGNQRWNTFYCLTKKGASVIGEHNYRYLDPRSVNNLDHQHALIDIMLSFKYGFPEHTFKVDYHKTFQIGLKKKYNPDAVITLIDKNSHECNFILELERSRSPEEIRREKVWRLEKIHFKRNGLSSRTKLLIVYAYERYNVFPRPTPDNLALPSIREAIATNELRFYVLTTYFTGLSDRYLFLPFHQFPNLHKSVWLTPKGNKVSLLP